MASSLIKSIFGLAVVVVRPVPMPASPGSVIVGGVPVFFGPVAVLEIEIKGVELCIDAKIEWGSTC